LADHFGGESRKSFFRNAQVFGRVDASVSLKGVD
jgi:hypothetical protein